MSLLVPGLGHLYIGLLPRALIWFGGLVLLSFLVSGGGSVAISAGIGVALSLGAAADAIILLRIG